MYTPKETTDYEEYVKKCFSDKYQNIKLTGELKIHVDAYFSISNSLPKLKKQHMLTGFIRPIKKPDWDNIGKIITDALNELAYHDDAAFVDAHVEKWYSDEPRIEVTLSGEIDVR